MKRPAQTLAAGLLVALGASAVSAAPGTATPVSAPSADAGSASTASTRTPKQILADYVTALGGPTAWARHKSLRLTRELEVRGMQVSGRETRTATRDGKLLVEVTLPGLGTSRQGTDGKVHWAMDPINGLRKLEGAEAEQMRVEATWNADLQLERLYKQIRVVPSPVPLPAGSSYECLELLPKAGHPAVTCFDTKTHLRVFQQGKETSPQGVTPYTATLGDWREVSGMKVPHLQQITAGPVTIEGRVVKLELDAKVDPKLFGLPKPAAPAAGEGKAAR